MGTMVTEFFLRALHLAYSFDPNVTSQERLSAEKYLMELVESPEGLHMAFHILNSEPVQEMRCFWAFNTIIHQLPALASSVSAAQAEELYTTLFQFIYRYFFTPTTAPVDFLTNKHAQLMAVGLRHFYPARWRGFFHDLLDLLARGQAAAAPREAVAMYFLRVCEAIDECVVAPREAAEPGPGSRARDMAVKDAMREAAVPRLVAAWYGLLAEADGRGPGLPGLCLDVLQAYIAWVDIALLTT
ncbi:unnamed protein product, partial [Phytomonas sp. Hart1]